MRDLITFAKNPRLSIPTFDLAQNPTPSINLNVEIKNITQTETPASLAKLVVYTPDRKTVLYRTESTVNLNINESTTIPIQFTLPEFEPKDYGICHVDYELYDAENNLIQLPTESDGGRFSIFQGLQKNDLCYIMMMHLINMFLVFTWKSGINLLWR